MTDSNFSAGLIIDKADHLPGTIKLSRDSISSVDNATSNILLLNHLLSGDCDINTTCTHTSEELDPVAIKVDIKRNQLKAGINIENIKFGFK